MIGTAARDLKRYAAGFKEPEGLWRAPQLRLRRGWELRRLRLRRQVERPLSRPRSFRRPCRRGKAQLRLRRGWELRRLRVGVPST